MKREEEAKAEPAPGFWDPFRWDEECKPKNAAFSEEGTKFKCTVTNNEGCTAICTPETTKYHNSYFKIKITNKNYEIMIGLKSRRDTYEVTAGKSPEEWFFRTDGKKIHNNKTDKYGSALKKDDVIECFLDRVEGTLSFLFNGKDQGQGPAFIDEKLKPSTLYWSVYIDRGSDEVKIL